VNGKRHPKQQPICANEALEEIRSRIEEQKKRLDNIGAATKRHSERIAAERKHAQ
jgi:hypothetical protein